PYTTLFRSRDQNPDQRDQEWGSNRNESATSSGEIAPDQPLHDVAHSCFQIDAVALLFVAGAVRPIDLEAGPAAASFRPAPPDGVPIQEDPAFRPRPKLRRSATRAAFSTHIPCTPPPGGVADEQR